MSECFLTNWNKTLVLASTHVKTYTVQKGERKEKKQTPIQTNFSLIRLAVGGLNLTKSKSHFCQVGSQWRTREGWNPGEEGGRWTRKHYWRSERLKKWYLRWVDKQSTAFYTIMSEEGIRVHVQTF